MEDVLVAVNEYVVKLNQEGGKLEFLFSTEREPRKPNPFRLSSSGKCTRRLAFEKLFPDEKEDVSTRAYNVFLLGDVLHELDRYLIGQVTELHSMEKEVKFFVDDEVGYVTGHTDGIVELVDGPIVLDVKTAATASFTRMAQEGPPPDYVAQLNAYMDALGIHRAALWVYDKNVSQRMVLPIEYDPSVVQAVRERFRMVWEATPDNLPPREYEPQAEMRRKKPTGREYLPWQCSYCPFVTRCWSSLGFERVVEDGKVRYIRNLANDEVLAEIL